MVQISDLVRRALKILGEEGTQALLKASLRFVDDRTGFIQLSLIAIHLIEI